MTEERKTFTADERKKLAASGAALPDGSFPIEDIQDLKNAIHAIGRASDPAAAKAHIIKRAKALGASSLLPDDWRSQDGDDDTEFATPPVDNLFRAIMDGGVQLSAPDQRDGRLGTLTGHFTKFNQWTKIDSNHEGRFLESVAPGAFKKAFQEGTGIRCLFQHGRDNVVGDKPLGPIEALREDEQGPYYEVPLLDTSYNRDLVPGLEAGLYGASFRFRAMRQNIDKRPGKSDMNPDGLPQRTLKEVSVKEFGPVTFPAYAGATAGIRSMTDEFYLADLIKDPERLARLISYMPTAEPDSPSEDAPAEARRDPAPASERRVDSTYLYGTQKRRKPTWLL